MKKNKNYIVIDFGTATTFDVITNNIYLGGIIAPGVNLSLENLINKASLIPRIKLNKTSNIIGKIRLMLLNQVFLGYQVN